MIKVFPERCSNCNYSGQPVNVASSKLGSYHYCYKLQKNVKYSDSCDFYKRREFIPPGVFTVDKSKSKKN